MKKSLIGQSEILTVCGTVLVLSSFLKLGIGLIVLGVMGALTRTAIDFQVLNEEKEERKLQRSYGDRDQQIISEIFSNLSEN